MTPIIFYVHYNGEITYGNEELQYQGQDAQSTVIRLKKKINFKKLRKKICSTLNWIIITTSLLLLFVVQVKFLKIL